MASETQYRYTSSPYTLMKTVRILSLILAASVAPAFAAGPAWDASGNSQVTGTYYFRQVLYVGATGGTISQAVAFYGNIVFSGTTTGTYSITAGTANVSGSAASSYSTSGTYSVSSSGYGIMTNPLSTLFPSGVNSTLYFLASNGILVGSGTESGYNDMFVAAPFSSSLSLGSLSGSYTISSFFPGGSPATSLGGTYQLNPNGTATLGNVSITGTSGAGATYTQNSSGLKLAFSNGAYTVSFPSNTNAYFYTGGTGSNGSTGLLFLYSSPDSNFVFGGTAYGFDMFVGVRNVASGTSTPLSGLYYEAGFDDSEAYGLDSYYGTFNASQGVLFSHERLLVAGSSAFGNTLAANYPTSISGSYTDSTGTVNYTIGKSGVRVGYGLNGSLGIEVGLPYTPPAATKSVYIDATGMVNTASSAPYTAGVSPGDFITLYNGVNLAPSFSAAPAGAFPTKLGGVTVLIDGVIQAPLYYVSPTQISFLIPYEVSTFPIASIQVNNNGTLSNVVTTNVYQTTPGVFSDNTGIGVAAAVDFPAAGGNPFVISESSPATGGDTIVAFLSGLGAPFPSNPDGALGVFDYLVQNVAVDVNGVSVGTPAYIGLAPGLAGLYQINFTVPALCTTSGQTGCLDLGDNSLGIAGPDSYSSQAVIPIGAGTTAAARTPATAQPAAITNKLLPRLRNSAHN